MPDVVAQDDCGNGVVGHPLAPEMPARLVAFREVVDRVPEPVHDVRLHWINNSNNANCFSVEARFDPRPGSSADRDWVLLETVHDADANHYLHRAVPALGEVCYRVQASNSLGRSDYSNRVCLEMEGFSSQAANPGVRDQLDSPEESSDSSLWFILAAALPAGAIVVAGGAFLWHLRVRRPRAGGG